LEPCQRCPNSRGRTRSIYVSILSPPRPTENPQEGPWYFDNHLLILDVLPENGVPSQVNLRFVPFWVQVHDIPTGLMSEKVGKEIANFIGEFLEYDAKNNSNYLRSYMKIRVLMDVTKPLKRQKKIKKPGGECSYIRFKYERLGNFCYFCGLLGHIEDYCEKLYSMESDDGTRLWSSELRVEKSQRTTRRQQEPPVTVTVSSSKGLTVNAESSVTKSANLANLLRNPQLMRRPVNNDQAVTKAKETIHSELLQEENSAAIISNKPKRSRGINDNEQQINSENQHNAKHLVASLPPTANRTIPENNDNDSTTPMDVSKVSSPFLLAEPGFQACQQK
jgi:hypothetical protein